MSAATHVCDKGYPLTGGRQVELREHCPHCGCCDGFLHARLENGHQPVCCNGCGRWLRWARQEQPAQPGQGQVLIELPRGDKDVLRVSLDSYEGKPFVSLRIWYRAGDELRPTTKGTTVRRGELDRVIGALTQAKQRMGAGS